MTRAPRVFAASASLVAITCAVTFIGARPAHAGGVATARFGADYGTPAMPNAYAVYYNPAALGGMQGTQLQLDGTIAVRSIEYIRSDAALTPSDPSLLNNANYKAANTGTATLLNVIAAPFFGMATDLGTKNVRLAFGTYIPLGGQADWSKPNASTVSRAAPGAIDGPQRWHAISGQAIALYNTVAAAYRLEKARISFGLSGSLIIHQVRSLRARNVDGSDDPFDTNGNLIEGRALIEANGVNFGASAGVYWEPMADRSLRLGLSYISQPGFGQNRLSGTLRQQFGGISQVANPTPIDFLQTYPDMVKLGAAYRLSPTFELRADLSYERWSAFKNQCVVEPGGSCTTDSTGADTSGGKIILNVPRKFRDTITARAGVGYWVEKETEIFASGGFGTGAIPKATIDPDYLDSTTIFGTVGFRREFTRHLTASVSYNQIYYVPVDTKGGSQLANFVPPSRSPSADGTYNQNIYFFNLNATYAF